MTTTLSTMSDDELVAVVGGKDQGIAAVYGGPNGQAYGTQPRSGPVRTPWFPQQNCVKWGGPDGCAFMK